MSVRLRRFIFITAFSFVAFSGVQAAQPSFGSLYNPPYFQIYNLNLPGSYNWPLIFSLNDYLLNTPLNPSYTTAAGFERVRYLQAYPYPCHWLSVGCATVSFKPNSTLIDYCSVNFNSSLNSASTGVKTTAISHELGHCLGMDHNTESDEIMYWIQCQDTGSDCALTQEALNWLNSVY